MCLKCSTIKKLKSIHTHTHTHRTHSKPVKTEFLGALGLESVAVKAAWGSEVKWGHGDMKRIEGLIVAALD